MRIALLFEYSTLNGGERSILAAVDWYRTQRSPLEFVAIGNSAGRLAEALRLRQIEPIHWSTLAEGGKRLPQDRIEASLLEVVSAHRPQLLHANSLAMGRLAGRLASQVGLPVTSHLRDIIKLSTAAVADLNRNHQLIAVSQATRDFHVAQGIDADRICVVQNGIDLHQFQPRPRTGRLRRELGLSGSLPVGSRGAPRVIINIGQLGLRKGQELLVAAAPAIVHQVPDAQFVFVGERNSNKAESIEFEQSLNSGFAAHRLSDRLHMLGYRDDVADLLIEADLLIHTAHQEPFGRVLLEATASGLPVVATDVGGTREIVEDQVTGLVVPPNDSSAIAAAAVRILLDDSLADRMKAAARTRAEALFSIERSAQGLEFVWRRTLEMCSTC